MCPEGATAQADSSSDCAPGLFQVWYVKAISIHVSHFAQSIEVTAYTSSGQQVEQFIGSGEVYKNFGTARNISVVTVSAVLDPTRRLRCAL